MLYEWLHILEEETKEESCARIHPHIQIRTICFDANFVPRKPGCLRFSQLHGTILFLLVIEVNFSLHYTYLKKKNSLCSKDAAPIASLIVLFSVLTPLLLPPHKFFKIVLLIKKAKWPSWLSKNSWKERVDTLEAWKARRKYFRLSWISHHPSLPEEF